MKEALKAAIKAMENSNSISYEMMHAIADCKEALAQPEQEPVAIHQHRIPYCADWYDGIPDHHDGHGPYEVRTLYTTPPKRPWVGLTDEKIAEVAERMEASDPTDSFWREFARAIDAAHNIGVNT